MKLYCKNCEGTAYRVDRIKCIKKYIPTDSDLVRRYLLCKENNIGWTPYNVPLPESVWEKFLNSIKESPVEDVFVFDENNVLMFVINKGLSAR